MDPLSLYDAGYQEGFDKGYKIGFQEGVLEGSDGINCDNANLDTRITALWGEIQTIRAQVDYLENIFKENGNGK